MPYVRRDDQGEIISLFTEKVADSEAIQFDNPDLIAFINRFDKGSKGMLQSDLQLIRVLEDLINILIDKHLITITDFPEPVIKKLLARQDTRKRLSKAIGMEFGDDEK